MTKTFHCRFKPGEEEQLVLYDAPADRAAVDVAQAVGGLVPVEEKVPGIRYSVLVQGERGALAFVREVGFCCLPIRWLSICAGLTNLPAAVDQPWPAVPDKQVRVLGGPVGVRHETIEERPCGLRHLVHRSRESGLVSSGRPCEAAQFADELQGRCPDLVVRGGRLEVVQSFDASTHARSSSRGSER